MVVRLHMLQTETYKFVDVHVCESQYTIKDQIVLWWTEAQVNISHGNTRTDTSLEGLRNRRILCLVAGAQWLSGKALDSRPRGHWYPGSDVVLDCIDS